jgi:hypothetical protein
VKGHFKDSFARHVATHCKELTSSNAITRWCRENIEPSIIYQGERLKCMKSAKTMNYKMCMLQRKEILQRMKTNKHKLINDNSDIFAWCSCKCRFLKFFWTDSTTLRTRLTQKSHPQDTPNSQEYARYSPFRILTTCQPAALNYAPLVTQRRQLLRPLRTPAFFNNVPGLPPRSHTLLSQCPTLNLHKFNIITSIITWVLKYEVDV